MSEMTERRPSTARVRVLLLAPFVLFTGLALLFYLRLHSGADPSALPSALLGRPVPEFTLSALNGSEIPGLSSKDLANGRVSVVNIWASWCAPCRDEHPILLDLSKDKSFDIVGINNKDNPENARRFLGQLGNPYGRVGADQSGRVSIDWGVYGVPETFVVDGKGRIAFKYVGPLDPTAVAERLMPAIRAAQAQTN